MAEKVDCAVKLERPKGVKSVTWDHFGFPVTENGVDKSVTVCRHCSCKVKYNGNTTNMALHLKRHHKDLDITGASRKPIGTLITKSESQPSLFGLRQPSACKQPTLADIFRGKQKLPSTSMRADQITKSIGVFMATDMRPYSVVENTGFKHLVSILEPRYEIPSRTHFSQKVMPGLYEETKLNVIEGLKTAKAIAITTDGWTSRSTESFITITAHYLNSNWVIVNPVLQTRPIYEAHTGTNLAQVLTNAVAEWNLTRPSGIPVVTDNASNIVNGVKEAALGPHIRCFAHTVNLAAQRGVQVHQLSRVLGRIRRVVSFFHRSTSAAAVLKSKQALLDLPNHKLIIDVSTRWNSTYDMIERYLEQQAAVFATLSSKDVRKNAKDLVTLSDSDVSELEDVVKLLKPLKTITTILCSEQLPTVSMILPLKNMIMQSMTVNADDSQLVKNVKTAIADDMRDRYSDLDIKKYLHECTALDPRFKSLPDLDEAGRLQVFTSLTTKAMEYTTYQQTVHVKQEPVEEPRPGQSEQPPLPQLPSIPAEAPENNKSEPYEPPCKKSAMDDLFGDVFITQVETTQISRLTTVQQEIGVYRREQVVPLNNNPLEWWKLNAHRFPNLVMLAQMCLGVPATSVPSERVFSTAGDIVSAQRAGLSSKNVDMLVFLKKNMNITL